MQYQGAHNCNVFPTEKSAMITQGTCKHSGHLQTSLQPILLLDFDTRKPEGPTMLAQRYTTLRTPALQMRDTPAPTPKSGISKTAAKTSFVRKKARAVKILVWLQYGYGVNDTENDLYQQFAATLLQNGDGCCIFHQIEIRQIFLLFSIKPGQP